MPSLNDDGIELIVPAFIPDDGLGKYIAEVHRRIARDLALVVGELATECPTRDKSGTSDGRIVIAT